MASPSAGSSSEAQQLESARQNHQRPLLQRGHLISINRPTPKARHRASVTSLPVSESIAVHICNQDIDCIQFTNFHIPTYYPKEFSVPCIDDDERREDEGSNLSTETVLSAGESARTTYRHSFDGEFDNADLPASPLNGQRYHLRFLPRRKPLGFDGTGDSPEEDTAQQFTAKKFAFGVGTASEFDDKYYDPAVPKRQVFGLDGTGDTSDSDPFRPHLSSQLAESFNVSGPSEEGEESQRGSSLYLRSSPFHRPGTYGQPNSPELPTPERKFFNFSRPTVGVYPSPRNRARGARTSFDRGSPHSQQHRRDSPFALDENTPLRVTKRVIRPDNWWQKNPIPAQGSTGDKSSVDRRPIPPTGRFGHSSPNSGKTNRLSSRESQQAVEESIMDLLHPESATAITDHRREAIRLAKAQEKAVFERCKRGGEDPPAYSFDELIGKGSFGRVYKGRQTTTNRIVAIKVIDIDEADFKAPGEAKDEQMRDFNKEIRILREAQESGAPNLNQMIEALPVHSQLWMVCEYCPGGSVKTLMRATENKLSERYIVVVARELAKALKGLHQAGIMHRDVKAANVLIHEDGKLQLCDFGVATVLDTRTDKRKTFIGTLHFMPPELWENDPEYSDEVDVWEFGCTIYECALGRPPNSDLREAQQLRVRMRRLNKAIVLPEGQGFSEELRSFVSYTLTPNAKVRPSMKDVLDHEYLRDTEEEYPTSSLSQLVKAYYAWLYSGGHRVSLFMPGGAVVSDAPGSIITPNDEWNFSTTESFGKRNSPVLNNPDFSGAKAPSVTTDDGEATPKGPRENTIMSSPVQELTTIQKANLEARVQRGADLSNLFDQEKPQYEFRAKRDLVPRQEQRRASDLPFRAMAEDRPTSIALNVIDLGDFDSDDYAVALPKKEDAIQLADPATIRAMRSDSKGPRSRSNTPSLTARNVQFAEDVSASAPSQDSPTIASYDFAFPPKEWSTYESDQAQSGSRGSSPDSMLERDPARKTMEWTFAGAMSAAPEEVEKPDSTDTAELEERARKHATLDWSFSNAMAEASTESQEPPKLTRTPARRSSGRPITLKRTMTQPVTLTEVYHAENEQPVSRPSTAVSEATSEASISSVDLDPFALEDNSEQPFSEAVDELGAATYYHTSGRTILPQRVAPYSNTAPGQAPYLMGMPARLGDADFPGPSPGTQPNLSKAKKIQKSISSSTSSGGSGGGPRPRVQMPAPRPPSLSALDANASPALLERELSRMFGDLQASLGAATQAMGIMEERRRSKKNGVGRDDDGKRSSSEWEDEEDV